MKAIGIILAGGNNNRMKELTAKRAVPALPVAGSFRSIDFALSSMSNSHIQTVAVLTQYNARSLNEHLSSSKWWNFGRKQGGLFLFTPTVTADNSDWYRGTADAMYQNIDFLKRRHEPYVIISSGDCVYKLDFNRVLDFHIEKKSDITVVCKDMMYNDDVSRFGVVRMDDESRITEFDEKPIEASSNTISTGIYVIRRRQLIELLEAAAEENRFDFVNDILVRYKNVKKIYGYKINSYWNNIADIDAYFKTNMDFLRPDVRSYFFREEPTICSKVDDLPPAKFNPALDYVIIEADGAKHHSLKYPAADEPVIYPGTTDVIIVLGTWEKGRSCKDVVFRYELMQKELGTAEDAVVDDSVIDTLRRVYVRKLRDSGFEGRVSCVFANERGWF